MTRAARGSSWPCGGIRAVACLVATANNVLVVRHAFFLLRALFQGGQQIPPPWPECGDDPTRDSLGCEFACAAN